MSAVEVVVASVSVILKWGITVAAVLILKMTTAIAMTVGTRTRLLLLNKVKDNTNKRVLQLYQIQYASKSGDAVYEHSHVKNALIFSNIV